MACISTLACGPFLLAASADMLPDLLHFAATEADLGELAGPRPPRLVRGRELRPVERPASRRLSGPVVTGLPHATGS